MPGGQWKEKLLIVLAITHASVRATRRYFML